MRIQGGDREKLTKFRRAPPQHILERNNRGNRYKGANVTRVCSEQSLNIDGEKSFFLSLFLSLTLSLLSPNPKNGEEGIEGRGGERESQGKHGRGHIFRRNGSVEL